MCLIDRSRRALSDGAIPVENFTREVFYLETEPLREVHSTGTAPATHRSDRPHAPATLCSDRPLTSTTFNFYTML